MRMKLSKNELGLLFKGLADQGFNLGKLSLNLNISERNLRDWRSGKITIPEHAYKKCLEFAGISSNSLAPIVLNDFWHIAAAAKKGAAARMKLYGNLGTPEGRRAGGLASIKFHMLHNTSFNRLKEVVMPPLSEDLAELLGILVGDGHLSDYQVVMTTNSITDRQHGLYTKELIEKIFKVRVRISDRKKQNAMTVIASSKNLVQYIHDLGMPKGDKIRNNLQVPNWIIKNIVFQKAFLRGLFDTDGCVYLDKHTIRGKLYKHMGWTITSYADKLIAGIMQILENLHFGPTFRNSQKSVFLRRQEEIRLYFTGIGSHNRKHTDRFLKFSGEVPKWS